MMKLNMGLAYLGLNKQSAITALIGIISRRIAILDYAEADRFETPSSELKRFLTDKDYRKMLVKVGSPVRKNALGKADLLPVFKDFVINNSAFLSAAASKVEFEPLQADEPIVDDQMINIAFGEIIGLVNTLTNTGLDADASTPMADSLPGIVGLLKSEIINLNVDQLFPDIHMHLTAG